MPLSLISFIYNHDSQRSRIAEIFYGEICTTIRQHLEGICNYFIHRTTNAVMEGLNNRSRVILRQTYGLENFEHLRSRLLGANH